MTEIELLRKVRARMGPGSLIGDDCARIEGPRRGHELLVTTDLFLENTHFLRSTHSAADVGHKVLARGLSDIAAMGGTPLYCFLSLSLPQWADASWVRRFYDGLLALAARHKTRLAGGDLAHGETLAADIVVVGEVPLRAALGRGGARAGDAIYVSGVLGGASEGLKSGKGPGFARLRRPEPRIALGQYLRGKATSCMDLSDGLAIDLHRLCLESKVAAVVDHPLPASPGASLEQALHGGDDYELLFTAPPRRRVPEVWRGLPLTRIGSIVAGRAGKMTFFGRALPPLGYDHFQNS
jgi:thiamine-monophosphate kinase